MIATHNPKLLDARLKQPGIRVRLDPESLPAHLLSSATVDGADLFAAPISAAHIGAERAELAQALADESPFLESIPALEDGRCKQVLLPWRGAYVAATPVPSGKVMDQICQRWRIMSDAGRSVIMYRRRVQPNPVAANNHGDPIASRGGVAWLVQQGIMPPIARKEPSPPYPTEGVLITATLQNFNASSNYVQAGLPAITAIGGAVHALERETGTALPFAVGLSQIDPSGWTQGLVAPYQGRASKKMKMSKTLVMDQISASAEIHLFLSCHFLWHSVVIKAASRLSKIAGGTLWNLKAQSITAENSAAQDHVRWIMPQSVTASPEDGDLLDTMLELRRLRPVQFGIVQSGFAFLHAPRQQQFSRSDNRLHVWAEPVFSGALLDHPLVPGGFWHRFERDNLVWWDSHE